MGNGGSMERSDVMYPGVVELGLDADHFAFFFELGAQDAEL